MSFMAGAPVSGRADEEVCGTVERMPKDGIEDWTTGAREMSVAEEAEFEEDDGRIRVGPCVEIEYEDNLVEEIERDSIDKCEALQ